MQTLIVVCGQSGVGKTTVIEKVSEKRGDLKILNYGERILAMALKNGLMRNPGDMNTLTPDVISRLQIQTSKYIHELTGTVVLDMHLTVDTPIGLIAGMPRTVMDALQPALIILLEAKPDDILKRRMTGKGVLEVAESIRDIQERADFDRAAAISIAIDIGIPIKILRNDDADKTAEEISEILTSFYQNPQSIPSSGESVSFPAF